MATNSDSSHVVHNVPVSLQHLSDAELLAGVRGLVGRSNRLLAELLAHLSEVEARGIHRLRACSSLYTYCIHELRLSEDEAFRRVTASRLVRRFPALFDALASGELHLTGLLMLGPHLTHENVAEVLARAKYRTKRELAGLVRLLDPLPAVPPRIEPLGPVSAVAAPKTPTWEEFVRAFAPVRDLAPGERPRDWVPGANDDSGSGMTADVKKRFEEDHLAEAHEPADREVSLDDSAPARELSEPQLCRVAPEDCSSGAPTDPDLQISRIRLVGLRVRYTIDGVDHTSEAGEHPGTCRIHMDRAAGPRASALVPAAATPSRTSSGVTRR